MQQVVKITGVFTESGVSRAGKDWTRWDVKSAGGTKFQTFDARLGKKAEAAKGQSVELTYHEETRGDFTNNVIDSLEIQDGPVNDVPESASQGNSVYQNPAAGSQDEFRRSKEEMRRTEAVKAAATLIASPNWQDDITIENLGDLAEHIAELIANGAGVKF